MKLFKMEELILPYNRFKNVINKVKDELVNIIAITKDNNIKSFILDILFKDKDTYFILTLEIDMSVDSSIEIDKLYLSNFDNSEPKIMMSSDKRYLLNFYKDNGKIKIIFNFRDKTYDLWEEKDTRLIIPLDYIDKCDFNIMKDYLIISNDNIVDKIDLSKL